jgi:ABC-type nitrate/sulfonate/bicarbonate transport system permease component
MSLSKASQERILAIASPIAILVIWQILSNAGMIDGRFVPSPYLILQGGWNLALSGELWAHVSATLYRLSIGLMIGIIPGIFIGMIMGLNRWVRAVLDPLVAAIYPVPKIAILPLLMLVFGLGDGSKIAAVAMSVFLLMIINTMVGVMNIERIYFDVARKFDTPWHKLFRRVILPAAVPQICAGLRVSLGVSLIVLVAAEFVASSTGIGYLIWTSWETLSVQNMFVGIIVITILGVLFAFLLKEAERLLMPWRQER